jgi:hypothetical protein
MSKHYYETKRMNVIDEGSHFRFSVEVEDQGMLSLQYEEWDADAKAWKAKTGMHIDCDMALAFARQIAEVANFEKSQNE